MLLREIKNVFHKELDTIYEREEVTSFFYLLIEDFLGLERFVLAMQPDFVISKADESPFFMALSKLKLQVPIQHILGKTEFMELYFKVNENVLIPRPETEDLVRWIIKDANEKKVIHILDIGTGSGCIAITIAKQLPNANVYALDVSPKALALAKENALTNAVDIEFIENDILELESLNKKFDIIVSNPPYVRELEKLEMQNNVLNHEPELALFVSNENPLIFYKKIADFAAKNLNKGGQLYFEINQYLGKETVEVLEELNFSEIELRKDIFGNDRMLKAVQG